MRTKPNRLLRPPRFPALILGGALLACLGPFPALALTAWWCFKKRLCFPG